MFTPCGVFGSYKRLLDETTLTGAMLWPAHKIAEMATMADDPVLISEVEAKIRYVHKGYESVFKSSISVCLKRILAKFEETATNMT